jgi:hypothetical protein
MSAQHDEIEEFFSPSHPSFKFEAHGDKAEGWIVKMVRKQQTHFDTGAPLFFQSGEPRMQVVVTLTPDTEDDSDAQNLYVRGQMRNAILAACQKAGQKSPRIGDYLIVEYMGDAKPTRKGVQGAKQYTAEISQSGPVPF